MPQVPKESRRAIAVMRRCQWVLAGVCFLMASGGEAGPIHDAVRAGDQARVEALVKADPACVNSFDKEGVTALRAAAWPLRMEIIDYLLNHGADINLPNRDKRGQTLLHYAVGRSRMLVEFVLAKKPRLEVGDAGGCTALRYAAGLGNTGVPIVELLLARGADVNARSGEGRTPLFSAVTRQEPCEKMLRLLLAKGADAKIEDENGVTPLHFACSAETVKMLLAKGADVKCKTRKEWAGMGTPLHTAAGWHRDPAVLSALLAGGADINGLSALGQTPLQYAARGVAADSGQGMATVEFLLQHGANPNVGAWPLPLEVAILWRDINLLKTLLAAGADPGANNGAPRRQAAGDNWEEGLAVLAVAGQAKAVPQPGAMPATGTKSPNAVTADKDLSNRLSRAVADGNVRAAKQLLESGADPNLSTLGRGSLLCLAIGNSLGCNYSHGLVCLLLAHGAKVEFASDDDDAKQTPLTCAIRRRDYRVASLLIENGANVNLMDREGETPLSEACRQKASLPVLELLIDKGADVNRASAYGPPLLAAAEDSNGHSADYGAVVLLLARDARVDATDKFGQSALHKASESDAIDVADLLLTHGADVNRQDQMGMTPLYVAAEHGHARLVEFLLEKGADPNAGGRKGLSQFKMLKDGYSDSLESIEVLRRHGAKP